jgi:hypothetical protein
VGTHHDSPNKLGISTPRWRLQLVDNLSTAP